MINGRLIVGDLYLHLKQGEQIWTLVQIHERNTQMGFTFAPKLTLLVVNDRKLTLPVTQLAA